MRDTEYDDNVIRENTNTIPFFLLMAENDVSTSFFSHAEYGDCGSVFGSVRCGKCTKCASEAEAKLMEELKRKADEAGSRAEDGSLEEKESIRKLQNLLAVQTEDNETTKERLSYAESELSEAKKKTKEYRSKIYEKENDLQSLKMESEDKYNGELRKIAAVAKRENEESQRRINS